MTIWRMRVPYWIPRATNIHSEYVILIAFLLQKWLHERASVLLLTYFGSIVVSLSNDDSEQKCTLGTKYTLFSSGTFILINI